MRFRLRYLHHDLELTEGQFVVGRSAGCQLSLDDPLVSRRHALLVVSREGVTVEDLGSRNGVVVNGERIAGVRLVSPGDKILIGSQELTVLEGRDSAGRETASLQMGKRTLPKFPAAPELMAAGEHASSAPPEPPLDMDAEPSMVRRADAFNLLAQTRPCPGPVIDELYNAFRKVNAVDLVRLRAYVAHLREKLATFGPAERFLIQRLEGLERLAALR
jgi:predicted component of type VI protein secretion system